MLHCVTPRRQGDLDKAKAHLLKALQMDPDAVQCQKDLREVKTLQGHHTRGNDAFTVSLLSSANTSGSLALAAVSTALRLLQNCPLHSSISPARLRPLLCCRSDVRYSSPHACFASCCCCCPACSQAVLMQSPACWGLLFALEL